ncbi:uncharacterized protein LOC127285701 [Leptopilina boulardi]|uniref:uncharacterized protein LOC127285701 n=1 Tax=Leptopilina boulardi TaxID=63433 RepID=UPI0021F66FF2|nr:uncharacterized protein LOC127285701 [Leptopilina boulardi]
MFRQIKIESPDCNLQRIVWRAEPSKPLQEYNLTTVTYGTRPAPFLAIRVLKQLASDERDRFPLGAQALDENTYVDDIYPGANSIERAIEIRDDLINILASSCITLSKWAANDSILLPDDVPDKTKNDKVFDPENSVSTLGLRWNQSSDKFHFEIVPISLSNPTKRMVASEIAKLFDPLGWLSPFLLNAKILLQDCWLAGTDWDTILPNNLLIKWNEFQDQFNHLSIIMIPRWIQTNDDQSNWELHGFADASERAYSAALYLVDRSADVAHSHLLISKTKLAPVKVISLPKLELCAAHLLAKLSTIVIEKLLPSIKSVYYWSDSQIVLSWLQGHPSRWKPFVANRVSEIHSISKDASWSHVRSEHNPADCATRGFTVSELGDSSLWWHGPKWLIDNSEQWPVSNHVLDTNCNLEIRTKFLNPSGDVQMNLLQEDQVPELLTRASSLLKLIRVTAYCFRFTGILQNRNINFPTYLTCSELRNALNTWIKVIQNEHFSDVINTLKSNLPLSTKNPITKLAPFLDQNLILRVKGRLENSFLSYDEKHPIILPKNSRLSELIVLQAHHESLHGGQQLTLSRVLRRYWIISAKSLINRVLRACVRCARFRAVVPTQLMGQLPTERVNPGKPFNSTGIDYAGPYFILPSKARGIRATKGYICLFVCRCTRAIHLELVSDLGTQSFLAAFKRFISLRGECTKVFSDNARNFVGAERELKVLFIGTLKIFPQVAESLANLGTTWSFIPPHSPHFGGIWEAGVKSVKYHLRRVIGETRLTFEEMSTVLSQITACLNSRPLYPNTSDPQSVSAVTLNHILTGGPAVAVPEPMLDEITPLTNKRWRIPASSTTEIQMEDNLPPTQWLLGRVDQLHPGRDGLSRVATIKTATSSYKRSFSKLVLLPIPNDDK